MDVFFGMDEKPLQGGILSFLTNLVPLGEPVPGYQGVNRRIQADNLFGMTYAECRRKGVVSNDKINQEKRETLLQTQRFQPEWNAPKDDPYLF